MKKRTKVVAAICSAVCLVTSFAGCGGVVGGFFDDLFGKKDELVREDLTLSRSYARYMVEDTADSPLKVNFEYNVSPELDREVTADENKVFLAVKIDYEEYASYAEDGLSHGEVIDEIIAASAERNDQTVNERLLYWFENSSQTFNLDKMFDNFGNERNVLRTSYTVAENEMNKRWMIGMFVLTNDEGTVTYEVGGLGDYTYDSMEASPSGAYIASECWLSMGAANAWFSKDVETYCSRALRQAVAEARGLAWSEWQNVEVEFNADEVIKMKVGETKKFTAKCKDEIDICVIYNSETLNYLATALENSKGYQIESDGTITAKKAGTYNVFVSTPVGTLVYTLEITE